MARTPQEIFFEEEKTKDGVLLRLTKQAMLGGQLMKPDVIQKMGERLLQIAGELPAGQTLTVDMGGASFVASSAIVKLEQALRETQKQDASLRVEGLSSQVQETYSGTDYPEFQALRSAGAIAAGGEVTPLRGAKALLAAGEQDPLDRGEGNSAADGLPGH